MPFKMRKVKNKPCFKVFNKKTKKVYAKCSRKSNAIKQLRLLRAIDNNPKFRETLKKSRKMRK
jgi:hypothetical protein|tara:strand:+ start:8527 stop:8715 length:189 start_codon:yes stop_codon:yes gene_type:complete